MQPAARDQRGLSDSVQWALLIPLILTILLGILQAGIWLHAGSVVANAALAGAEAQSLAGSGAGEAERVARSMTDRAGLGSVRVTVDRTPTTVRVAVSGRVQLLLTAEASVSARASRPLELP